MFSIVLVSVHVTVQEVYRSILGSVHVTAQDAVLCSVNVTAQEVYSTVHVTVQEVYKELSQGVGRDSPESGSLYSDYESGHQYEQVWLAALFKKIMKLFSLCKSAKSFFA
jgi:hypothetical protein